MTEQTSMAEQIEKSRDSLSRASIEIARAMRDVDDLRRQAEAGRRRLEEEKRTAMQEYYRLAGRVLEILGDLDAEEARDVQPETINAYLRSRLEDAIAREGIARMAAQEGVFDPRVQEVVGTVPDNAFPDGMIVRTARTGYVRGPIVLVKPGVIVTRREAD